jgi:DNA-directed RNA polymerase subunit M/transcription elongation factor TFIIS
MKIKKLRVFIVTICMTGNKPTSYMDSDETLDKKFNTPSDNSWVTVSGMVRQLDELDNLHFPSLSFTPKHSKMNLLKTPEEVIGAISNDTGVTCPKCKKRNVTYNVVAIRSGDEGMTPDCECRVCGHRFRLRN